MRELELELRREPAAALEREVESREADRRVAELLEREAVGLPRELLRRGTASSRASPAASFGAHAAPRGAASWTVSLWRWPPSCPTSARRLAARTRAARGRSPSTVSADGHVALTPRVGQRPGCLLARRRREPPHLVDAERLAVAPRSASLSISRSSSSFSSPTISRSAWQASLPISIPCSRKRLAIQRVEVLAHRVDEDVADLGDGLAERRVRLQLLAHEAEHRARRGRAEVIGDRVDVRCLPAAASAGPQSPRRPSTSVTRTRRASPSSDPALQAATTSAPEAPPPPRRTARSHRDRSGPRRRSSADLDLRPIVAGDDVGGLELRRGHVATLDVRFRIASPLRPER